jgi:hypothetical protein
VGARTSDAAGPAAIALARTLTAPAPTRRVRVGCATTWLILPWVVLGGCAGSMRALRPADFPEHAVEQRFALHWRLDRSGDVARADGLVELQGPGAGWAALQLIGLDAAGNIVSFNTPEVVRVYADLGAQPFELTVRARGSEQRFRVRVQSFGSGSPGGGGGGR